jgi:gluconolactonase
MRKADDRVTARQLAAEVNFSSTPGRPECRPGTSFFLFGELAMMYLDRPPHVIESRIYTSMPQEFRRKGGDPSAWAKANKGGQPVECFIEGPSFDPQGNLYVVDIPYGRVFRISPDQTWSLITEYDGQPNGLKFHPDGRILIADYANGLLELDPARGTTSVILKGRNGESFKGINDINIASNGDIYFTDQGQTGLQDQTGRVYLLKANGDLQCLLDTGISPNGLTLDRTESTLYVAMTRDNAVWRLPLTSQGGTAKVGRFCSLFGTSGPDGLAMDEAGNLAVAHASLGQVFLFAPNGELIARVRSCAGPTCTNVAYGGQGRRQLFITESSTGTVLMANLETAGIPQPRTAI